LNVFYAPPQQIQGEVVCLTDQEAHHALHVLRIKTGQTLWVTDGMGHRYETRVERVDKSNAWLQIHSRIETPPRALPILAVGMIKQRDRLEWMVEKSVELGVSRLILMHTHHSERTSVREDRIRQIQISAMKQCLSNWLPALEVGLSFEDLLDRYPDHQRLIAHEKATQVISAEQVGALSEVVLCIGPEGGFSDREIELAEIRKAQTWWLGPHRLRAETAAIAALSWVTLTRLPS
jgi:16S rRNA (uracil1498-N3)-methyltransferase